MQLNPRVWQELRHTNLAELAQQAPHLLVSDGASSAANMAAGGSTVAANAGDSRTSGSGAGLQASADRSSRSAGSSGRQSSMHDVARSRRVVEAMQLSPEQRAALGKVCPRDMAGMWVMTSLLQHCKAEFDHSSALRMCAFDALSIQEVYAT